jgi:hypothetical protein
MGSCSEPCGPNGTVEYRRHVEVSQAYGGECKGGLSRTEPCNRYTCPVNCIGAWHHTGRTWTTGSCRSKKECKEYKYKITRHKAGAGAACPAEDRQPKEQCTGKPQRCH